MTLTCPGPTCPLCVGQACNLCAANGVHDLRACDHNDEERHTHVPATDRVPTRPLDDALCAGRIEIDLEDPTGAAAFLELVAKIVRAKKRLVFIVE